MLVLALFPIAPISVFGEAVAVDACPVCNLFLTRCACSGCVLCLAMLVVGIAALFFGSGWKL